jgi:hypothetical protein
MDQCFRELARLVANQIAARWMAEHASGECGNGLELNDISDAIPRRIPSTARPPGRPQPKDADLLRR